MTAPDPRSAFWQALKKGMADLHFATAKGSASKDRLKLKCADGTAGVLQVVLLRGSSGPGGFEASNSLVLEGGRLRALLDTLGCANIKRFQPTWTFAGSSLFLVPGRLYNYRFCEGDDAAQLAGQIVADAERIYVPIVDGFSGDWASALDFVIREPRPIPRPYATALVLAALAGQPGRLDEFVAA